MLNRFRDLLGLRESSINCPSCLTVKRLLWGSIIALVLAITDLYVVNLSVYLVAFWIAWIIVKE